MSGVPDTAQRHVLRTIPSYLPYVTGPANQAREISRRLAEWAYVSHILTTDLGAASSPRRERLDGVEVTRLPIQCGVMQYHIPRGLVRPLANTPAHLVHVHSYRNFLGDAAAFVAHLRDMPLIVQLHGCLSGYRQMLTGRAQWPYAAYDACARLLPTLRAARFVVSTPAEAHEATLFGLDRHRIHVIPMGIDVESYVAPGAARDPAHILFVGRLSPDRNVDLLLRALALIADRPWTATIVGSEERRTYAGPAGHVEELQSLAGRLGIADRLTFAGALHGAALRRAYASAAIFAYPSRYENFGQTILEAAAAGCALLTTPVGVAQGLVWEGQTGFTIEQDDAPLFAARLRWLLAHPVEAGDMGERARALARRDYTWSPIAQQYKRLYDEALTEHAHIRERRRGGDIAWGWRRP